MGMRQKWIWSSDVIYQSDPIFQAEFKNLICLVMWPIPDAIYSNYSKISCNLIKSYSLKLELECIWKRKTKDIICLYLAPFGCYKYIDKIMILISYKLSTEILMILWGHPKVITCTKYWLLSLPREMSIYGACDCLGYAIFSTFTIKGLYLTHFLSN